ncbi:MAG: polyprenyl synthetase family protein [Candidatus Daviesbacteria bacterium]|nr:polyprenyl synthetase family protein [Candidatus Daviesbacteria bacterium]
MDFEKYLKTTAKKLDREVEKILKEQLEKAEKTDKKLVPLLQAFAKTCQGGKRIRGVLVILGYEIARGKEEIIKIGAAYEIMHGAILIHDDIIDQSITRRNRSSLYQTLGGNHYGISQAISLGDYGFFLAFKIIADTKAGGLFSQVMMETAFGQMLELKKANPLLVMKLKTACYTIAGPMQIGAVLAGAGVKLIRALGEFGENLGIAYQIKDDILDGDVKSPEKAKEQAGEYKNKAMKVLPEITKDKNMSKLLEQMGEYLVRRTK